MTERPSPDEQPTTEVPTVSAQPATRRTRVWPRRVPARIGRARTSTLVLALLFVAAFFLWEPRLMATSLSDPAPASTTQQPVTPTEAPATSTSEPVPTTTPQETTPTTPAPSTTSSRPTTTAPSTTTPDDDTAPTSTPAPTTTAPAPTTSSAPTTQAPQSSAATPTG